MHTLWKRISSDDARNEQREDREFLIIAARFAKQKFAVATRKKRLWNEEIWDHSARHKAPSGGGELTAKEWSE